jgi:hypothetical protein
MDPTSIANEMSLGVREVNTAILSKTYEDLKTPGQKERILKVLEDLRDGVTDVPEDFILHHPDGDGISTRYFKRVMWIPAIPSNARWPHTLRARRIRPKVFIRSGHQRTMK